MIETEWRTTDDWRAMLEWLLGQPVSDRKWILYACGGLRQIWDRWLYSDHSRNAVEVAERAADGLATEEEIKYAAHMAECPTFGYDFDPHRKISFYSDSDGSLPTELQRLLALGVLRVEVLDPNNGPAHSDRSRRNAFAEAQAEDHEGPDRRLTRNPVGDPTVVDQLIHAANVAEGCFNPTADWVQRHLVQFEYWPGTWLLREVFGNPFTPPHFVPAWRTETTTGIAAKLYDDKAFERMPILADALEEAGCDNADILSHCREPGVHVRGCWVVDLVLGKA